MADGGAAVEGGERGRETHSDPFSGEVPLPSLDPAGQVHAGPFGWGVRLVVGLSPERSAEALCAFSCSPSPRRERAGNLSLESSGRRRSQGRADGSGAPKAHGGNMGAQGGSEGGQRRGGTSFCLLLHPGVAWKGARSSSVVPVALNIDGLHQSMGD